jgi:hypothetical protein
MVENELFSIDDKTQKVKTLGVELARANSILVHGVPCFAAYVQAYEAGSFGEASATHNAY